MSRPFFSMGPYKARCAMAASSVFTAIGDASGRVSSAFSAICRLVAGFTGTLSDWAVGSPIFTEGNNDTYDVSATGPSGYASGGTYDVDPSGNPLPQNMTLSFGGVLQDGGATTSVTNNVIFGYNEPGSLPTLTLHSSTPSGTLPYLATAFPAEGTVPFGTMLVSAQDPTLRGTVISKWPDNSARVVVIAGHKSGIISNSTVDLTLRPEEITESPLDDSRIAALVTNITFSGFTGSPSTLTLLGATPDRTWWKNSQVICNRYRHSLGLGVMEAVIDIHAFSSNRAFVEVVIENCKFNPASPSLPLPQSYTNASITMNNGAVILISGATPPARGTRYDFAVTPVGVEWLVSEFRSSPPATPPSVGTKYAVTNGSSGAFSGRSGQLATWNGSSYDFTPGGTGQVAATSATARPFIWSGDWYGGWIGGHEGLRSWYCSGWVGGDPGIEVTHDTTSMQAHPWFWKNVTTITADMSARWGSTTYTPWSSVNLPAVNMGGTGGGAFIGVLPKWDADYISTGSKFARRASIANALAQLKYDVNYRDSNTGKVPESSQLQGKIQTNGTWPRLTSYDSAYPAIWETAHQPASTLGAFLCQPSPCFIDLAQKVFVFNHTFRESDGAAIYNQVRGRAWIIRNMAQAEFLTPDDQTTWKSGARSTISLNVADLDLYRTNAGNPLGFVWNGMPYTNSYESDATIRSLGQDYVWQHHWLATVLHHIDKAKVLTGTPASALTIVADWAVSMSVRFIMEPLNGEWRAFSSYQQDVSSTDAPNMTQPQTWAGVWTIQMTGTPPAMTGEILFVDKIAYNWTNTVLASSNPPADSPYVIRNDNPTLDDNYASHFRSALCCAVERDVQDAFTAYNKVMTGITNYATWMASGASTDGRNNRKPRNV